MPAYFSDEFWNVLNPELWVGAGLLIFLAILVIAGVPKLVAQNLDAQAAKIKADLDEAARIRSEAEALLTDIKMRRQAADQQAAAMIAAAHAEAARFADEARKKLDDDIVRRLALAERKIAIAESQATAEVKAAAVDLATQVAQQVLTSRLAGLTSDPMVDAALAPLAGRFG